MKPPPSTRSILSSPHGIRSSPIYSKLHKALQWHSHWSQHQTQNNKLAIIKPLPYYWSSSSRAFRKQEMTLNRLRIGHRRFTHTHFVTNLFPLSCPLRRLPHHSRPFLHLPSTKNPKLWFRCHGYIWLLYESLNEIILVNNSSVLLFV